MNKDTHAEYGVYAKRWQRTRAACEGQEAVHGHKETFLPKLAEQKDTEYNSYVTRATYFNACGRTLEGLVGMVFRKDAVRSLPAGLEAIAKDLDLSGNSIDVLAMRTLAEVIRVGRLGMLVEYPQVNEAPSSQAQASQLNLRPYVATYPAESILDWRIQRINNSMQPVMIKLLESYEVSKDIYTYEHKEQVRCLLLENGRYIQRVYRKENEKTDKWVQFGADIIPLMNNQALSVIPFWCFGAEMNSLQLQNPPILPLADLNLAHYRVSADYEHGCHFAGLPTPVLAGVSFEDGASVAIGSPTCISSTDPNAKWGFLEFTGQGLGALEKNLATKETQMAAIGARMLEQQKSGVESEGAMQMRANGESSVLAALANLVSENFEQILTFISLWAGISQAEIEYKLNTDYLPVAMTSQQLAELVKALQANTISYDTFFYNLKRGEVIDDKTTLDEEKDKIANAVPVLSTEDA